MAPRAAEKNIGAIVLNCPPWCQPNKLEKPFIHAHSQPLPFLAPAPLSKSLKRGFDLNDTDQIPLLDRMTSSLSKNGFLVSMGHGDLPHP
jgi:hypothetical protein